MNVVVRMLAISAMSALGIFLGAMVNWITRYFVSEMSETEQRTQTSSANTIWSYARSIHIVGILLSRGLNATVPQRQIHKEILVEVVCGVGTLIVFLKFGFTTVFFTMILFLFMLIAIFRIDMEKLIIPDVLSLNGIAAGFLLSGCKLLPDMDWRSSISGIVIGATILYVPAYIYRLVKGTDGLGGGDVKLMAMVGAFTGVEGTIFTLFVASFTGCLAGLIGSLYSRISSDSLIPFGPFISSGAILYVFCGKPLISDFLHFPDIF